MSLRSLMRILEQFELPRLQRDSAAKWAFDCRASRPDIATGGQRYPLAPNQDMLVHWGCTAIALTLTSLSFVPVLYYGHTDMRAKRKLFQRLGPAICQK